MKKSKAIKMPLFFLDAKGTKERVVFESGCYTLQAVATLHFFLK